MQLLPEGKYIHLHVHLNSDLKGQHSFILFYFVDIQQQCYEDFISPLRTACCVSYGKNEL